MNNVTWTIMAKRMNRKMILAWGRLELKKFRLLLVYIIRLIWTSCFMAGTYKIWLYGITLRESLID